MYVSVIMITNGPSNTTVCTNQLANFTCGFVGSDLNFVVPDWRIIRKDRNQAVISDNTYIRGTEIIGNTTDRLEWIPDLVNLNNNVLIVDPVSKADNQSSYQCILQSIFLHFIYYQFIWNIR